MAYVPDGSFSGYSKGCHVPGLVLVDSIDIAIVYVPLRLEELIVNKQHKILPFLSF